MNKKKIFSPATLMMILMVAFFAGIGIFFASYQLNYYGEVTIPFYLYTMAILVVSLPLHVVLHELGHLLAGWISGYQFIMFRLFSNVWIQTDDGLSRRKEHIPGLMGQALMIPPEETSASEKPSFLLYHLGGILLNSLTAVVFIGIGRMLAHPFIAFFFYLSAIAAAFLALLNLLPFKGTDGYNILNYVKNPNQEDEILALLYLYQDMVKGVPFSEIQANIQVGDTLDLQNPNSVTFHSLKAVAAFEQLDFSQAREIYAFLWEKIDQMMDAHKAEVSMNYLFTLLLTEPTHPAVAEIQQGAFYKQYQKIKQADSYRLFAAEAMYAEQDDEKARNLLAQGRAKLPLVPTLSDEQVERILYDYLETQLDEKQQK